MTRHRTAPAQARPDGASLPRPIPLAAELIWLPFVFVTLCLGLALYPRMPEQVPMRIDLAGNVTEYAEKSLWLALLPAFLQAFTGACFAVAHRSILCQPGRRSFFQRDTAALHGDAAAVALARARYARAWSRYVLWLGVALAAGLACMPLALAGIVGLGVFALAMAAIAAMALVVAAVLSARYGLDGTRAVSLDPRGRRDRGRS